MVFIISDDMMPNAAVIERILMARILQSLVEIISEISTSDILN